MQPVQEHHSERARQKAVWSWCMYDWANSAFITTIGSAVMPTFFGAVAAVGLSQIQQSRATQIWGLTTAIAAAIVAVLAVVLGPIADYSASKKRFLGVFAGLGIVASLLMVNVGRGDWILAVVLYVAGSRGPTSFMIRCFPTSLATTRWTVCPAGGMR